MHLDQYQQGGGEEIDSQFEQDFLIFLMGFRVYLLSELDDRLKVNVGLFFL